MKDHIFSGSGLPEALLSASQALGVPAGQLRYVVLDPGGAATAVHSATPARIAVLLDAGQPAAPAAERGNQRPDAPATRIRRVVAALAEAAGVELAALVHSDEPGELAVELSGPGRSLLLADGGAPLLALEHLLRRSLALRQDPDHLRLRCEGFREARDAWLSRRAQALASQVRADGEPRETEPLNAYDRRVVHVALGEAPGLRTFSVGEGADRRVTVALADPADLEQP